MSTRRRAAKKGGSVDIPEQTKRPRKEVYSIKNFLDKYDNGYSIVINYTDKDKNQYFAQYKCDVSGNILLPYNPEYYNPDTLLSRPSDKTIRMREFFTRASQRKIVNKKTGEESIGICQGRIGQAFFTENFEEYNDTKIVLIEHSEKKEEKIDNDKIKAFILANKNEDESGDKYSYYISLICSDPNGGFGSIILKWFINFFLIRTTNNPNDPAFNVDSLSLSAISTVLFYYPRFGYLHVRNCSNPDPKEEQEIADARRAFTTSQKKMDTKSDQFINFLFLLTRKSFNYTANDDFCRNISSVDFSNKDRENVDELENFNIKRRATRSSMNYSDFDVFKKRLEKEEFQNRYNTVKTNYDNTYEAYTANNTPENRRAYFDATFDLAKFLYDNFCEDQGYTQKLCRTKFIDA